VRGFEAKRTLEESSLRAEEKERALWEEVRPTGKKASATENKATQEVTAVKETLMMMSNFRKDEVERRMNQNGEASDWLENRQQ
jgi:hypothetical protein